MILNSTVLVSQTCELIYKSYHFFWQLAVKNNLSGFLASHKISEGFAVCIKFFDLKANSGGLGVCLHYRYVLFY